MESPFRSEEAAFKFLLITLAAFAVIVFAAWIDTALGFVTWIAVSAAAVWYYLRQRGPAQPKEHVDHVGGAGERRVLVVANEAIGTEELMSAISTRALSQRSSFLVVCPAVTSTAGAWTSDEDPPRSAAQERLEEMVSRLAGVGIEARGEVGDIDPLVAVEDAVRAFHPDEIVIATHPAEQSSWHEKGVAQTVAARYDVPVEHLEAAPREP